MQLSKLALLALLAFPCLAQYSPCGAVQLIGGLNGPCNGVVAPTVPTYLTHIAAQTSGSTSTVTTAAINTTGATLIFVAGINFGSGNCTVSDSAGNTWIQTTNTNTGGVYNSGWYVFNPTTSASHTFTLGSGSACYPALAVEVFTGPFVGAIDLNGGGPTFGQAFGGTSSPLSSNALTPAHPNEVCIIEAGWGAFSNQPGSAFAMSGGFTVTDFIPVIFNAAMGVSIGYTIQTTAVNCQSTLTWTYTGMQQLVGGTFSFR